MTENLSGRDIGALSLKRFIEWIAERDAAGDWKDYIHRGKLNKSEISYECGFTRSVFSQNAGIIAALADLEDRLREIGVIAQHDPHAETKQDIDGEAFIRQTSIAKSGLEKRVKTLEEQNAALRAEVSDFRKKLLRYQHIDDHLCRTGRLPPE